MILISFEIKSARHGRHAGRITGGTECYGHRYPCDDPLTSLFQMSFRHTEVARTLTDARNATQYPHHQRPIRSFC